MSWKNLMFTTGAVVLVATACDATAPLAPESMLASAAFQKTGASCEVDVGTTENPLFAMHELVGWVNDAVDDADSDINCGVTRSLDAKMEVLATALDRTPPNFAAACGASTALLQQLNALVGSGQLAMPTFEPPFPGGPTNVVAAATDLSGRWCAAARGELVGPRS